MLFHDWQVVSTRTPSSVVKLAVGRSDCDVVRRNNRRRASLVIRAFLALSCGPHFPAPPATSLPSYPVQALLLPLFPIFSPSKVPRSSAHAVHVSPSATHTPPAPSCFSQPDQQPLPPDRPRPTNALLNIQTSVATTATRVQLEST